MFKERWDPIVSVSDGTMERRDEVRFRAEALLATEFITSM